MRNRMWLASAVALLALTAIPAEAQQRERGGPGGNPEMLLERLTEELALTPEQVEAVRPILAEQATKQRDAFQQHRGNREEMRSAMMALQRETDERLGAVLTEEQMQKWRELRARMRQRRGN